MVFALAPDIVMSMIGLSWPKFLLGSKESDPTAWRVLSDACAGKTNRPQKKTLKLLADVVAARCPGVTPLDLTKITKEVHRGGPWEVTVAYLNDGLRRASSDPLVAFEAEAVQMERLADVGRAAVRHGDFKAALESIQKWDMNTLPCLQWAVGNIDCRGPMERFATTASPVIIASTLYLLACWAVDWYGADTPPNGISILPERRGERVVRPMTRWLESVKATQGLPTVRALSDFILAPGDEDVETQRRVFRRWWSQGEVPPWSRVPHIARSVGDALGEPVEQIRGQITEALGIIRLMDGLLDYSLKIRDRLLPDYDPLSPFRDYPLMRSHALEVRAALSLQQGQ